MAERLFSAIVMLLLFFSATTPLVGLVDSVEASAAGGGEAVSLYMGVVRLATGLPRGVYGLESSGGLYVVFYSPLSFSPERGLQVVVARASPPEWRLEVVLENTSGLQGYRPATSPLPGALVGLDYDAVFVADNWSAGAPGKGIRVYGLEWSPADNSLKVELLGSINTTGPVSVLHVVPGPVEGSIAVHYYEYQSYTSPKDWEAEPRVLVYSIPEHRVLGVVEPPYRVAKKSGVVYLYTSTGKLLGQLRAGVALLACEGGYLAYIATYPSSGRAVLNVDLINASTMEYLGRVFSDQLPGVGPYIAADYLSPTIVLMTLPVAGKREYVKLYYCNGTVVERAGYWKHSIYYDRITVRAYSGKAVLLYQSGGVVYAYAEGYGEAKLALWPGRYVPRIGWVNETAMIVAIGYPSSSGKAAVALLKLERRGAEEETATPTTTTTTTGAETTTTSPPATTTTTTATGTPTATTTTTTTATVSTTTTTSPSTTSTPATTTTTGKRYRAPITVGDWLVYHVVVDVRGDGQHKRVEFDANFTIKPHLVGSILVATPSKKLTSEEKSLVALGGLTGNMLFLLLAAGVPIPVATGLQVKEKPTASCPILVVGQGKPFEETFRKTVKGYDVTVTCRYTGKGVLEKMRLEVKGKGKEGYAEATLLKASRDVGLEEGAAAGGLQLLSPFTLAAIAAVVLVAVIAVILIAKKR